MKTFRDPRLMIRLGMLQVGVGNADLVETQGQSPTLDVSAELGKVVSGQKGGSWWCGFGHG